MRRVLLIPPQAAGGTGVKADHEEDTKAQVREHSALLNKE